MAVLWAYVFVATWWVKLIPLYGGYAGRARPGALAAWYAAGPSLLGHTAMLPEAAVLALAALSTVACVALAAAIARAALRA